MHPTPLRRLLGFATACTVLFAPLHGLAAPDKSALKFGSVAMDIPTVMHKRLLPLTEYLSQELQQPVTLSLSQNMSAATDDVARGKVDIAYLTPVAYLDARRKGHVRLVAKMVTQGRSAFQLMLVVRADSPIRSVAELKGKSFAFGDKAALLQRAAVVSAGIRLEDLGSYRYIGHYDNIARGVASGDFDAGVLKDSTAFEWEKKGLRVIWKSPDLPPYNIVTRGQIDDALFERIRAAFLRLDIGQPAHASVIKTLDPAYDGFAAATDAEYDVVRKLIEPFREK